MISCYSQLSQPTINTKQYKYNSLVVNVEAVQIRGRQEKVACTDSIKHFASHRMISTSDASVRISGMLRQNQITKNQKCNRNSYLLFLKI